MIFLVAENLTHRALCSFCSPGFGHLSQQILEGGGRFVGFSSRRERNELALTRRCDHLLNYVTTCIVAREDKGFGWIAVFLHRHLDMTRDAIQEAPLQRREKPARSASAMRCLALPVLLTRQRLPAIRHLNVLARVIVSFRRFRSIPLAPEPLDRD